MSQAFDDLAKELCEEGNERALMKHLFTEL